MLYLLFISVALSRFVEICQKTSSFIRRENIFDHYVNLQQFFDVFHEQKIEEGLDL